MLLTPPTDLGEARRVLPPFIYCTPIPEVLMFYWVRDSARAHRKTSSRSAAVLSGSPSPAASVDEIGYPKKSSGHYKVSKSVLLTLYSV